MDFIFSLMVKLRSISVILVFSVLVCFPYFSKAQQNVPGVILNPESTNLDTKAIVDFLPFFNKQNERNGHSSPLPFGLAVSGLIYEQEFNSTDLKIKATTTYGQDIYAYGDTITQNTTAGESKAYIKPNIWVLPFLNVYGIIGFTSGHIKPELFINGITVKDIPGIGDYYFPDSVYLNNEIKYLGNTYGFGSTFSMGYQDLIFLLDYHFTVTKPYDIEGNLHNHFLSAKIAWIINPKAKNFNLMIWAGALYLNNNQSFKGEITVEEIAPELVPYFGEIAEYSGNIEAKNAWNALIGVSLTAFKHHNLFVEFGFANRQQASVGYGFMF